MAGQGTRALTLNRDIRRLAIPALGALAADPLVSLIDTAFVGRLGTTSLGALGVDAAIFGLAFVTFNVFQYGLTPLVAQAEGAGDPARTSGLVRQAIIWALVLGLGVAVVLSVFSDSVLSLMQTGADLIPDATTYLRIRAFAAPAVLLVLIGHGAYRGLHDTVTPLVVTLGVNAINLILDPLLIFGLDWGIAGAAAATVVAQWVGALWFLALIRRRILTTPPSPIDGRLLARVGRDVTIRTFALVGALTVGTAAAARIGDSTVAAHQIASQIFVLVALITDSLAVAAQAMVGSAVGAGQQDRLGDLTRTLWRWGLYSGLTLGVLVWAGRPLLGIFSQDGAVIEQASAALLVVAALQPVGALVFVGDGIYLGAGRFSFLAVSTAIAAAAAVAVFVGVLALGGGIVGIWLGIATMICVRGGAMLVDQRMGLAAS